jgi:two-component system copper resistance phosphate regulon response regulator CusR
LKSSVAFGLELTMRILLIEDNPAITALIHEGLAHQDYELETASTGGEGEERAASGQYDAIILDILLPDRNGIEVCKNLRARGIRTPILILTALTNTLDKVAGLEAGADDYLTKPFEVEELSARLRALVRRGGSEGPLSLRFDDLEMNLVRRMVTRGGQKIRLTNKEFDLLEYLMRNAERVLTRDDIGRHVRDMNFQSESNLIDVYISMLRRKIDRDFPKPLIQTVIGKGYKLGHPEEDSGSEMNVQQATSA